MYNNYTLHSTIEMTPRNARKKENVETSPRKSRKQKINHREYPEIRIGDKVRKRAKKRKIN